MKIGVLALQGDFAAHARRPWSAAAADEAVEVRKPEELDGPRRPHHARRREHHPAQADGRVGLRPGAREVPRRGQADLRHVRGPHPARRARWRARASSRSGSSTSTSSATPTAASASRSRRTGDGDARTGARLPSRWCSSARPASGAWAPGWTALASHAGEPVMARQGTSRRDVPSRAHRRPDRPPLLLPDGGAEPGRRTAWCRASRCESVLARIRPLRCHRNGQYRSPGRTTRPMPSTESAGPRRSTMAALICEVVYRGIFQKNLAARITRGIVLSARKAGRLGHRVRALRGQPAAQRHPGQGLRDRGRHARKSSSRTWRATSPSTSTSRSAWTTRCPRASSRGRGTGCSPSTG